MMFLFCCVIKVPDFRSFCLCHVDCHVIFYLCILCRLKIYVVDCVVLGL